MVVNDCTFFDNQHQELSIRKTKWEDMVRLCELARIGKNNKKNNIPRWWDSKISESESKLRERIEKYYNFSYMLFDGNFVEAASVCDKI